MKNSYSGAKIVSKAIKDSGVDTLFWYPGRDILPLYHELMNSGISVIRSSHERLRSSAWIYRSSGRISFCTYFNCPGSVNALMGLACIQRRIIFSLNYWTSS